MRSFDLFVWFDTRTNDWNEATNIHTRLCKIAHGNRIVFVYDDVTTINRVLDCGWGARIVRSFNLKHQNVYLICTQLRPKILCFCTYCIVVVVVHVRFCSVGLRVCACCEPCRFDVVVIAIVVVVVAVLFTYRPYASAKMNFTRCFHLTRASEKVSKWETERRRRKKRANWHRFRLTKQCLCGTRNHLTAIRSS